MYDGMIMAFNTAIGRLGKEEREIAYTGQETGMLGLCGILLAVFLFFLMFFVPDHHFIAKN
jgi:hypothetical protein